MSVLLLRLAGPLQAWGVSSRFTRRETRHEPSKSGVLGLLAAAQGRRRTDPVEDLAATSFGVRTDQPGRLLRDFQTAHRSDGSSLPLSYRYYLSDAVFLAGVQGDSELLEGLREALLSPVFPLFLGRRSCPPAGVVLLGLVDADLQDALADHDWMAAPWWRRTQAKEVDLPIVRDARDPSEIGELVRDHPISYAPEHRQYGFRTVVHGAPSRKSNPLGRPDSGLDFMAALGGS